MLAVPSAELGFRVCFRLCATVMTVETEVATASTVPNWESLCFLATLCVGGDDGEGDVYGTQRNTARWKATLCCKVQFATIHT